MKPFFVYILECNDDSYYTGHTDNIEQLIAQHQNKENSYTAERLPVKVVFLQTCAWLYEAIAAEQKIKGHNFSLPFIHLKNERQAISMRFLMFCAFGTELILSQRD